MILQYFNICACLCVCHPAADGRLGKEGGEGKGQKEEGIDKYDVFWRMFF